MKRDVASGALLMTGAAAGVVVMGLHPTAHGLMNSESAPHLTQLNVMVHGLALTAMPMIFLGLLGLWNQGFAKVNIVASSVGLLLCREGGEAVR